MVVTMQTVYFDLVLMVFIGAGFMYAHKTSVLFSSNNNFDCLFLFNKLS